VMNGVQWGPTLCPACSISLGQNTDDSTCKLKAEESDLSFKAID
jgi:hypothetical protein